MESSGCNENEEGLRNKDTGASGALGKAKTVRSPVDSPILMNTVKIVVQPPAPVKSGVAKANRSNPCVVSAAEAEKDCITATNSGLGDKRSVSESMRRSKRVLVAVGARSKSGSSIAVASPSVLDTESCENLINERLELRSTRSLSFGRGRRSRSRCGDEVGEGLTTIDTSCVTVPTAAARARRSEWDDDDDDNYVADACCDGGGEEQGAVGGPIISASVRV
jgi:hypothetical protein